MAKKALARLGVETKDLNGNLRPFEELLDEIADKMKDLGSAEQIELTKKIAGAKDSRAFTVLLEQRAHIKKLRDELKAAKGEAKEMASIMGDNAAGDEKVLEAAWSALKTEIGTQLLPYYRELLQTTTELINAGREWGQGQPGIDQDYCCVSWGRWLLVGCSAEVLPLLSLGLLGPLPCLRQP